MSAPHPWFSRIAWAAVALALCVIVFGAFVRLSHAGLSCPDWPTCYGKATWPKAEVDILRANEAFPQRAVEVSKAWLEQFHRHIAALLGVLVLTLAAFAARHRRHGLAVVFGGSALVAIAIPLYMREAYTASVLLTAAAELALLGFALRWCNRDFARIATITLAVIIFQATLGLWTVTWLLKPVVVMAHLIGGLTTFSLILWMAVRSSTRLAPLPQALPLRGMLWSGLAIVGLQIALGGWVSANYAALACSTDFPRCLGQWWPETDFAEAFVLWRGIGVDYEGGVLDGPARTAIQLAHRIFAIAVLGHLLVLALRLRRTPGLSGWGWAMAAALGLQLALGISNVIFGLPLAVATAHNAGAVLLLAILVTLLARARAPDAGPRTA
jgi:heme a synthase